MAAAMVEGLVDRWTRRGGAVKVLSPNPLRINNPISLSGQLSWNIRYLNHPKVGSFPCQELPT